MSINQFISFSKTPLQGIHHMDIEMVKNMYTGYRSDMYNFQCHTFIQKQTINKININNIIMKIHYIAISIVNTVSIPVPNYKIKVEKLYL
jgi:hypothetical protein